MLCYPLLHFAAIYGYVRIVKFLLICGYVPLPETLELVIANHDFKMVECLIYDCNVRPSNDDLTLAIFHGDIAIANMVADNIGKITKDMLEQAIDMPEVLETMCAKRSWDVPSYYYAINQNDCIMARWYRRNQIDMEPQHFITQAKYIGGTTSRECCLYALSFGCAPVDSKYARMYDCY